MAITEAWREKNFGRHPTTRRIVRWWTAVEPPYFQVVDYDKNAWMTIVRRADFEDLPLDVAVEAIAVGYECHGTVEIPLEVLPL
jgi:hypothetical protein